jgi:hypothetical protein
MEKKEKMSFGKWFRKVGIKDYGLLMSIVGLIDYFLFFSEGGIQPTSNISIIAWISLGILLVGLHIVAPLHMISSFKKQR